MDNAADVAVLVAVLDNGEGLRMAPLTPLEAGLFLFGMSLPLVWGVWDVLRRRRQRGR